MTDINAILKKNEYKTKGELVKFKYEPGATPLDPDEINGLIPKHINTQGQLDERENANIQKAQTWLTSLPSDRDILTIDFMLLLHKKMFDETWKWAGTFRHTLKNIGVEPPMITTKLKNLLDDVVYQIINTIYPIDEIAYRFHHRLVWVHPFPNGNGRHARMMTDLLLTQAGAPRFTWGGTSLVNESDARKKYIAALRGADSQNYTLLAEFVRS